MAAIHKYRGTAIGDEGGTLVLSTELARPVEKQATIGAQYGILRGESPNLIWIVECTSIVEKADQWALAQFLSTVHAWRDGQLGTFTSYDETPTLKLTLPNALLIDLRNPRPSSPAAGRYAFELTLVFGSSTPPEF